MKKGTTIAICIAVIVCSLALMYFLGGWGILILGALIALTINKGSK